MELGFNINKRNVQKKKIKTLEGRLSDFNFEVFFIIIFGNRHDRKLILSM